LPISGKRRPRNVLSPADFPEIGKITQDNCAHAQPANKIRRVRSVRYASRRMIIWINGAFGAGKTSVARRLTTRLDGAWLLDPEKIGFVLQRWPGGSRGDFQNLPAWRRWTTRAVGAAARLRAPVVVPMTLVNREYFHEIIDALRQRHEVRHFSLIASRDVLRRRLRARGSAGAWGEAQIERCASALADPLFADAIDTDTLGVEEVAAEILRRL
jgi:chloramphenicol 3-O-phosphotransferase